MDDENSRFISELPFSFGDELARIIPNLVVGGESILTCTVMVRRFQNPIRPAVHGYNVFMPGKGDRSRRRRPQKGFPHRVAGYLDLPTHDLVAKAAEDVGESISTFVARAVKERAEAIRKTKKANT